MTVPDLLQQLKSPSMIVDNDAQLKTLRECRGIGTAATRHSTYEKTKKRKYMLEDDNARIAPTRWGIEYLNYLHPELVSAGLTEKVELAIKEISQAENDNHAVMQRDRHLGQARKFITKHIKIALNKE